MKVNNFLILSFALLISLSAINVSAQKSKRVSSTRAAVGQKGSLSIEAGLVFRNGDVKPAARVQFHLLDKDLETIIDDANINFATLSINSKIEGYAALMSIPKGLGLGKPTTVTQIENAIKPHIIATATTDFSGKASFSNIKSGAYYLMGVSDATQQIVIWNLKTEMRAGRQSLVLDNKNASVIY